MKNETKPKAIYTAREVVEILNRAKQLGVTSLKLDGFEASFLPQLEAPKPTFSNNKYCGHCNSEMVPGRNGLYCKSCFIARKEAAKKKW